MNVSETIQRERDKLVYGLRSVRKALTGSSLKTVIISQNCPQDLKQTAQSAGAEVVEFEGTSSKLGTLCGRPHAISVVGVYREKR
jgi:ribosomal protein L30E